MNNIDDKTIKYYSESEKTENMQKLLSKVSEFHHLLFIPYSEKNGTSTAILDCKEDLEALFQETGTIEIPKNTVVSINEEVDYAKTFVDNAFKGAEFIQRNENKVHEMANLITGARKNL